ncbi:MAG TPA: nicotinate-nucleotide adenylyltransferase [Burkholderiales bacterium]|jgi:nicotinate-nucleotide adenylyltransferase
MIGLLGGTFDPIHYGHLRPAREVYRRLGLAELRLVPAATPPHRDAPAASAAHRLRMVELAAAEFPGFAVDDREIRRGGKSYTVPTLKSLRAEIGATPLCLLVGSDAFAGLPTWHRWEQLFGLAHFVVMERPGAPLERARAFPWAMERVSQDAAELGEAPAGRVVFVPVTPLDVSATRLRAAIARGETPSSDELPAAVWKYIDDHRLYRSAAR